VSILGKNGALMGSFYAIHAESILNLNCVHNITQPDQGCAFVAMAEKFWDIAGIGL
jgi:hypothetical protein